MHLHVRPSGVCPSITIKGTVGNDTYGIHFFNSDIFSLCPFPLCVCRPHAHILYTKMDTEHWTRCGNACVYFDVAGYNYSWSYVLREAISCVYVYLVLHLIDFAYNIFFAIPSFDITLWARLPYVYSFPYTLLHRCKQVSPCCQLFRQYGHIQLIVLEQHSSNAKNTYYQSWTHSTLIE